MKSTNKLMIKFIIHDQVRDDNLNEKKIQVKTNCQANNIVETKSPSQSSLSEFIIQKMEIHAARISLMQFLIC